MALPKTKVLSISDYQYASEGMFRVIQWIESEPYQLDDEVTTVEEAKKIADVVPKSAIEILNPAIYNDQGEQVH